MADLDFDEFEGAHPLVGGAKAGRLVNMMGAACSVCLVIGLAVWGYKLAVRDVSGIPVVRALEGPLRVAPENPGGDIAMHQGLSVNAVAAVGTALPLPERVVLAPKEATLSEDDAAGLAVLTSAPADLPDADVDNTTSQIAEPVGVALAPVEVVEPPKNDIDSPSSDLAVSAPIPETQADAVAAALAAALADDVAPESGDADLAVTKSLRPKARPQEASGDQPATVAVQDVAEVDPTTIAAGTNLVQLGAFDDEAGARTEWTKLQGQFPDLIGTKALVVQPAQSGGRTFYRLRAQGFENEDETRRFCAALLAENASCIAVAQR